MRLPLLIATTLFACTSIDSVGECPAMSESFTLDPDLDEAAVQAILDATGESDIKQVDCGSACTALYRRDNDSGWDVEILECKLSIDEELTGDAANIIGSILCDGRAVEYYCAGRRPLGHIEHPLANPGLPAYLAHCAHLEAASVLAFTELADRLTHWHAPAELILRCRQAAREETTHAELLATLTGLPITPPTRHTIPVDLAAAALDNAIEGCVHEAWAALTCAATAQGATSPELRAIYTRIAADEANHAQLAWDLHTWFMGQVTTFQRTSILAAQQAALAALPALARAQARHVPPALAFPGPRAAAHFAAALAA